MEDVEILVDLVIEKKSFDQCYHRNRTLKIDKEKQTLSFSSTDGELRGYHVAQLRSRKVSRPTIVMGGKVIYIFLCESNAANGDESSLHLYFQYPSANMCDQVVNDINQMIKANRYKYPKPPKKEKYVEPETEPPECICTRFDVSSFENVDF